jgi:hypothetical protein
LLGLSFPGSAGGELTVSSFAFAGSNPDTAGPPATPAQSRSPSSSPARPPTPPSWPTWSPAISSPPSCSAPAPPTRSRRTCYTLSNVLVSSIQTSISEDDQPVTTVTLAWATLSESYTPTLPNGTLGQPVVATWDVRSDTATGVGTPGAGSSVDVTSQFRLTQSGFRYNRATQQFARTITISYLGSTPVVGPITLSLEGLEGGTLAGASTSAGALGVSDGGFILLPSIGVGQSLTITLLFNDPSQAAISYNTHILNG